MNKYGIDISQHQGKITDAQWNSIKLKAGYVIIRYGYRGYDGGLIKKDSQFDNNIAACKKYGIPYGIYFFSQAITASEAKQEVDMIAKDIDLKSCKYGIACDTETSNNGKGRADKISKSQRTTAVKAFLDRVIEKGGIPVLYTGYYWLRDQLDMTTFQNKKYNIWCACYLSSCLYKGDNLVMWQYSSKNPLKITGFSALDCNVIIKDYTTDSNATVISDKNADDDTKKATTSTGYTKGQKVTLKKGTKLYPSESATTTTKTLPAGNYYIYDGTKMSLGRYRITTKKEYCGKTPIGKYVTGYVAVDVWIQK